MSNLKWAFGGNFYGHTVWDAKTRQHHYEAGTSMKGGYYARRNHDPYANLGEHGSQSSAQQACEDDYKQNPPGVVPEPKAQSRSPLHDEIKSLLECAWNLAPPDHDTTAGMSIDVVEEHTAKADLPARTSRSEAHND